MDTKDALIEIVHPKAVILSKDLDEVETFIERVGRVCYKSEDRITDDSSVEFIRKIVKSGHHSVLEHASVSVKILCSRACSHQLVRHRLGSYSQESQRYCNYKRGLAVVPPIDFVGSLPEKIYHLSDLSTVASVQNIWLHSAFDAYAAYTSLLDIMRPEDARSVLPNCIKTEVNVTFNLRQWRHFFKLRCDKHAQAEIRIIALKLLDSFTWYMPNVFGDLYKEFLNNPNNGDKND